MYTLSDQQITFIQEDIRSRGIHMESLQHSLLDHICTLIEENLEEGGDFEAYYARIIPTFYKSSLNEIEEEALFLAACGNRLVLTRNQFFGLLFTVVLGPFAGYDILWVTNSPTGSWHIPLYVWGASFVYSLFPLLILLVLFFTPDRLDPPIPKRSRVLLGIAPLIRIVPLTSH